MVDAHRIAIGSIDFAHLAFDDFLARVGGWGVSSVELYPESLAGSGEERAAEALRQRGVSVCCVNVTPKFRLGGTDPESTAAAQAETVRCIGLAARLGAPFVNTYVRPRPGCDPFMAAQLYRRDLEPVLEAATRAGVTILVENLPDPFDEDPGGESLVRTPERLAMLAEVVGSAPWGVTYDPAGFHIAGAEAYPYAYRLLRPHIRHMHFKDVTRFTELISGARGDRRILRDSRRGEFLTVPVGRGAVHFEGILAGLRADGYAGHLVIEPHTSAREADAATAESVAYLCEKLAPERGTRRRPAEA